MIIMSMGDAYLDAMFKAIELGKILAFYQACRSKGTLENKGMMFLLGELLPPSRNLQSGIRLDRL